MKTPNLAHNKDSKTAAGESTVCEEKDKGDGGLEDIESDEEGKVEDISAENRRRGASSCLEVFIICTNSC